MMKFVSQSASSQEFTPPHRCQSSVSCDNNGKDSIISRKKRLDFIDLAKGICILLVVCFHAGAIMWTPLLLLRMPLYFMLSGMFYKDYGGFIALCTKKIDKLIIPFLFFLICTLILTFIIRLKLPAVKAVTFEMSDFMRPVKTPAWFLLSLFWDNIIFYIVKKISSGRFIFEILLVSCIFFTGLILSVYNIFLPLHITSAVMSFIFFFIGSKIRYINFFSDTTIKNSYNIVIGLAVMLFALLVGWICRWPDIDMYTCNARISQYILYVLPSTMIVIGFLILCKAIKRLPIVSFAGHYSIIILGFHNIFLGVLIGIFNSITGFINPWPGTILTIGLCLFLIPICLKFFPYVTAQKELMPIIKNYLHQHKLHRIISGWYKNEIQ